jgi:O-antigen/teichoic acid export membrane protein
MIAAAPIIAHLFNEPNAAPIIQALALRPVIDGLASIKVAALNRNLLFRPLAVIRIVEALVNAVLSIVLALEFGVWGLVAGVLGGSAAATAASYIFAPYRPRISFDRQQMRLLMNFGRWIFYSSIIAVGGNYVLRLVISRELGAAELGIYFLAAQLAFLPSDIANEVVGAVAFPLYARLQANISQAVRTFQAILTGLAALLLPACALIIVLSPVLVQVVLGPQWAGAEPVIQVLAFVAMLSLFGDTTVPLLKGHGRPVHVTQIELLQSVGVIALVWFFTNWYGLVGAALAWILPVIAVQVLSAYFVRNIFKARLESITKPLLTIAAASAVGALIAAFIIARLPNLPGLVLASGMAGIIIAGLLWISDRRFSLGLLQNLVTVFPQLAVLPGFTGQQIVQEDQTK